MRKGLALDPRNPRALSDLGTHLLRTGDEQGARTALEQSFKEHPYDVVTYNLLQMMDTLDKFVTVRDGDFIIRMDKDEAPVHAGLRRARSRNQAMAALTKRYQFTPKGPILIEIFPKHDDFAVRNVGLPGMIGALGACFGRVVTMDSPKARPPGEFQWEAHAVARARARDHAADVEPARAALADRRHLGIRGEAWRGPSGRAAWTCEFAGMLNHDETIKLQDLNAAFTDPRTINLAYFQASLLVEHIVDDLRRRRAAQAAARLRRRGSTPTRR